MKRKFDLIKKSEMGGVIITRGKADKCREFSGYVIVKYETYLTKVE